MLPNNTTTLLFTFSTHRGEIPVPLKAHPLIKELDDAVDGTGDYSASKMAASGMYKSGRTLAGGASSGRMQSSSSQYFFT